MKNDGTRLKVRTKPVVLDAIQFCGVSNLPKVLDFILDGHSTYDHLPVSTQHGKRGVAMDAATGNLKIPTPEGLKFCRMGDWVVKTAENTFYPVDQETFDDSFEPVEEAARAAGPVG